MLRTRLTELLGIELPIVGGAFMDLGRSSWVAAVSNAGALGVLASAIFRDEAALREDLRRLRDLTDRPFAVNVNLFPSMRSVDHARTLDACAEAGVRVVETSGFSPPEELVARIRERGIRWMHKCVSVRHALKAERLGADAITVVGYENGGATGLVEVSTLVLVPATVQAVHVPVVGGGGVVDGGSLLAMLALGAQGAVVGSRLLLTDECPIHPELKQALLRAAETDTAVVGRSTGFPHRVLANDAAKRLLEQEAKGATLEELWPLLSGDATRRLLDTGDPASGTVSCSQGIGLVHEIRPLREVLRGMADDAERRLSALAAART